MKIRWPWTARRDSRAAEDAARRDLLGPVTTARVAEARRNVAELRGVIGWSTYLILNDAIRMVEARRNRKDWRWWRDHVPACEALNTLSGTQRAALDALWATEDAP